MHQTPRTTERLAEKLDDVVRWSMCIISIRMLWLDKETGSVSDLLADISKGCKIEIGGIFS